MATTTTNFNFPIPQSTDLVKDGATAIAALGTSIDTDFVDLKGGTTGQILSKASNTDLDYTWITNDVGDITAVTAGTGISGGGTSGAVTITNSMATAIDAKGDLVAGTAADTFSRLAVGSNSNALIADSSTSTGLRWNVAPVQVNPILNSCMDIWQRGTSFNGDGLLYCADRWTYWRDAYADGITASRQLTNDTTNLPFVQYCLRIQRDSGTSGTGLMYSNQPLENVNSTPYIGQTVTLSAYVRKGANFSASSGNVTLLLRSGTGTDQAVNGMTGAATVASTGCSLTADWVRFSVTGTVAASAKQIGVELNYTPSGTAGANDYFEFTGVQIDIGSVAQPLRRNGNTLAAELAACQRYYFRSTVTTFNQTFAMGQAYSTTQIYSVVNFPVTMRTTPTALEQSGTASDYRVWTANFGAANLTSVPAFNASTVNQSTITAAVASGLVAGNASALASNSANAYLGWSAEL